MRVKVDSLVITFATTAAAMSCEVLCHEKGLPGRMIPVPTQVSAGCGLAWKASPADRPALEAALGDGGVAWEAMQIVGLWELSA